MSELSRQSLPLTIDLAGRLKNRNYVWDTDLLEWIAQSETGTSGSNPTGVYAISDIADGDPAYYGFVNADGNWYIMRSQGGAFRYAKGTSGYATAWTGRAGQSYDYFDAAF